MSGPAFTTSVMKFVCVLYFLLLCSSICSAGLLDLNNSRAKYPHMKPWLETYCDYYPERC